MSRNVLIIAGDLVIDVRRRKVTVANRPIDLTIKEFELLLQFARNPGHVYSRQELLDLVWGPDTWAMGIL